jgi:hypothetical protein
MKTIIALAVMLLVATSAFAYGTGISDESNDQNSYGHGIAQENQSVGGGIQF